VSHHLDPALADLARAQRGAFSARQAHTFGVSDLDLHRLVRAGRVVRVRRGAFVRVDALEGLAPEAEFAVRTQAVLLSRDAPSWASHHCALAVSGLPLVGAPLDRFDLCAQVRGEYRNGDVVTRPLPPDEPALLVDGVRTVSTETALVQTAARYGIRPAVVALDAALGRGVVTTAGLERTMHRLDLGIRGHTRARQAMALADPASESPGESLTRMLLHGLGVVTRSQVVLRDSDGVIGRVDLLVDERIVVEFDGLMKYEGAEGRTALAAEKRREDRLRAAGYQVIRLTWADLDRPERVARLLRQARARLAMATA
jgi:very-short-patch-repair endonuclease